MALALYFDYLSQPSRALLMFVRAAHINSNEVPISLLQAEHMTEEFAKINPFKKCPAIVHDGFRLSESVAIFRYLCRSYPVSDYWYPVDSQRQARVDEFMEWQHMGLRAYCALYFLQKILRPMLNGGAVNTQKLQEADKELERALNTLENVWLKGRDFVAGNHVSIADLLATQELEQARFAGYDITHHRPQLAAYLERVRKNLNPIYDEVMEVAKERVDDFKKDLASNSKSKL